jgi:hypothetical protein
VVLLPVPVVVAPPGLLVRVQVPEDGSPLRVTLPVATPQVGWVLDSITGGVGVAGAGSINPGNEGAEIQPATLLTVKV